MDAYDEHPPADGEQPTEEAPTGEADLPPHDVRAIDGLSDWAWLGAGGFARVYRAYDRTFGRLVAVKVLQQDFDDKTRRRFRREQLALGVGSGHPNIVTVFSSGKTSVGRGYIIMEYVPNGSLQDCLDRKGPLPWPTALEHARRIAAALAALHDKGEWHLDVKPANILLALDEQPKLADFGIAHLDPVRWDMTATASRPFTVAYVAPELLRGEDLTDKADVYMLAATVVALVTGCPPFVRNPHDDPEQVKTRTLEGKPPDLRRHGVPDAVCNLLERAMDKSPGCRPTAAALEAAFGSALDEQVPEPSMSRSRWIAALGAAAVVVVAATAPLFMGGDDKGTAPMSIPPSSSVPQGSNGDTEIGRIDPAIAFAPVADHSYAEVPHDQLAVLHEQAAEVDPDHEVVVDLAARTVTRDNDAVAVIVAFALTPAAQSDVAVHDRLVLPAFGDRLRRREAAGRVVYESDQVNGTNGAAFRVGSVAVFVLGADRAIVDGFVDRYLGASR